MENIYWTIIGVILIVCYFLYYPNLPPKNYLPFDSFNPQQYVGKWHEVYRSDNIPFEQNLNYVTATYTMNEDGNLDVFNQGARLKYENNQLKIQNCQSIQGKAYLTDYPNILLVQFYPIFRSPYTVLYTEDVKDDWHYDYAVVAGGDYIWFLSRNEDIPSEILKKMKCIAKNAGYDLNMIRKTQFY